MEYRLLTSPLAEPLEGDNCGSVSEPSTPIKSNFLIVLLCWMLSLDLKRLKIVP